MCGGNLNSAPNRLNNPVVVKCAKYLRSFIVLLTIITRLPFTVGSGYGAPKFSDRKTYH